MSRKKSTFKHKVLDLAIIGLILELITFTWNTVGVFFGLSEIGILHSISLVLTVAIFHNLYFAFNGDGKLDEFFYINSHLRSSYQNIIIIGSIIVGYFIIGVLHLIIRSSSF